MTTGRRPRAASVSRTTGSTSITGAAIPPARRAALRSQVGVRT